MALREVLSASMPVDVAPGAILLEHGGEPADAMFVVRRGAVELELEGEVLDVLGPGESFGFPSLVTGDHPAFDVRARGDTSVLRIDREVAERWLGSAPGLRYLAIGMRRRAEIVERADRTAIATSLEAADTLPELVARASGTAHAAAALHDEGYGVRALGREIARAVDAVTVRALDLHLRERKPPPAPWAWLSFGSVARRESGLGPDQDHTIVWDGAEDADPYFADLAEAVTATLEAAGWPRCPSGVLATSPGWRGTLDHWVDSLLAPSSASGRAAFLLALALDARKVAGPLRIEPATERLRSRAGGRDVRWRVARLAIDARAPIGAFGGLDTQRHGDRRVVDVKAGGLLAVTDLARSAALDDTDADITTPARLRAAAELRVLSADASIALEEAFETFRELRWDRQVACLRAGEPLDDMVEPSALDPVSRIRLREAFRVVDAAQADLRATVGGGRFRLPSSS